MKTLVLLIASIAFGAGTTYAISEAVDRWSK